MSELDYYRRLLSQLSLIVSKLNAAINGFDPLKTNLNDGLTINEVIYKKDTIDDCLSDIINERNKINNVIIPAVNSKISALEEEERRAEEAAG